MSSLAVHSNSQEMFTVKWTLLDHIVINLRDWQFNFDPWVGTRHFISMSELRKILFGGYFCIVEYYPINFLKNSKYILRVFPKHSTGNLYNYRGGIHIFG